MILRQTDCIIRMESVLFAILSMKYFVLNHLQLYLRELQYSPPVLNYFD